MFKEASKRASARKKNAEVPMNRRLRQSQYGWVRRDYWVAGDLRVTPKQQIDFFSSVYENRLPFSPRSVAVVKDILVEERTDKYVLRAKNRLNRIHTRRRSGLSVTWRKDSRGLLFRRQKLILKNKKTRRSEITRNVLKSLQIIE